MFVTIVIAALVVDGIFGLAEPDPERPRPTRGDVFGSIEVDYKLFLNIIGARDLRRPLFWVSRGRGGSHDCEHHARDAHFHHIDNQPHKQEAAGV